MIAGLQGKDVLEKLVGVECQDKYKMLNNEEREELKCQLEEHKAAKATAHWTSNKSWISNVTHTVRTIEQEVSSCKTWKFYLTGKDQFINLKLRTGVEALVFVTRETTNLGLQGLSFATGGVERFLLDVMKVDTQDFMGCLEGYAVNGLQG